jgi:hypothetical protein
MTEEVWPDHDVMTLITASDGISRSSQSLVMVADDQRDTALASS